MSSELLFRTRGLDAGYSQERLVRGIDVEVHTGEIIVICGPNGAGKTCLALTLAGRLPPLSGLVEYSRLIREHAAGWVQQKQPDACGLPISGREIVEMGLAGCRDVNRDVQVREALEAVGAAGLADRNFFRLSGGERQRLLIACALVRNPSLLLLDEPTNHLDKTGRAALAHVLAHAVSRRPCAAIVITHDLELAKNLNCRIWDLKDGRLVETNNLVPGIDDVSET